MTFDDRPDCCITCKHQTINDELLETSKALLAIQDTDSIFRLPSNLPELSNLRQAVKQAESEE